MSAEAGRLASEPAPPPIARQGRPGPPGRPPGEPDQTEPRTGALCKDELLPPGTYTAIRLEHLASTELAPADKLILACLANDLRGAASYADKTIGQIAAGTALGLRTVQEHLRAMEKAGHLVRLRGPGGRALWGILPTPTLGFIEQQTPPPEPQTEATRGAGAAPLPCGSRTPPRQIPRESRVRRTPLYTSPTKQRTGTPPAAGLFQSPIEQRWSAAYRQALGHAMPSTWYAVIRAELASPDPDPGLLQAVTARIVGAANDLARRRKKPFGPGWVLNFLRDAAAADHARRQRAENPDTQRHPSFEDEERAAAEQAARQAEAFAGLDDAQQAPFLARAERELKHPSPGHWQRADVVKALAAFFAWQELHPETAP